MPTSAEIRRNFRDTMAGARAVFSFCLNPHGIHTDAGVEAAFLQMFKGWEGFLEEAFIAFMRGRLACDGQTVPSHMRVPSDEIARSVLYQHRPYIEWTRPDEVRERAKWYFNMPNRVDSALAAGLVDLRHMARVRNAIAHSSMLSRREFYKLVQGKLGGKPTVSRPAQYLLSPDPASPPLTVFDRYATVLEVAATAILG
jgi:hypothetical protein